MFKKVSFVLIIAAIAASCHTAQKSAGNVKPYLAPAFDATDYKSLLWEISGKDLINPSFLYGTIHLIDKKDFFLTDLALRKFAESKRLALEVDIDDPMTTVSALKGMYMKGGQTIKELVTEADYQYLSSELEKKGLSMSFVKRMKPILVSAMLTEKNKKDGGDADKMMSYEIEFSKMAKKQKIDLIGLETAEFQLSMLDSIPYKEQAKMLIESMRSTEKSGEDELAPLIRLYKKQNIDSIYQYIHTQSAGTDNFEAALLDTRNRNWIPVISKKAKEKVTFFAVGAGHLGGKRGVIQLLRDAGYTVRPLY